jgi:hypothetical protein
MKHSSTKGESAMKLTIASMLLAAVFAGTTTQAEVKTHAAHSASIIVEQPSTLPELAQIGNEAMYLQDTNDGRTFLYIEATGGQKLSILNVTNPAAIKGVALVAIAAPSPFDFVQSVGDYAALIRYRNHSGFAVLNFRNYNHPEVTSASQFALADSVEKLGTNGLLLTSDGSPNAPFAKTLQNYNVVDTTNPTQPALLATISGVKQRLSKADTGTLFLLSDNGVTVVRRLHVEAEHTIEQMQQMGN